MARLNERKNWLNFADTVIVRSTKNDMGASTKKRKHQQFELSKYFKTKPNGSGAARSVGRPLKQKLQQSISPIHVPVPLIDPSFPDPRPAVFAAAQANLPDELAVKTGWRGDEDRIADSWVEAQYKLLFATPTTIRLRLFRTPEYRTKRPYEKQNNLPFATSGRRLASKTLCDALTAAMQRVCETPTSKIFVEEFVTDLSLISHPLCLRVISERISNGYYVHARQWLADVRQVAENAWQSNEASSEIAVNAHTMWKQVITLCRGSEKIKNQIPQTVIDEFDRRQVLQARVIMLGGSKLPFPSGVRSHDLPKSVLRRLARRNGQAPEEWPQHWKSNATAP